MQVDCRGGLGRRVMASSYPLRSRLRQVGGEIKADLELVRVGVDLRVGGVH